MGLKAGENVVSVGGLILAQIYEESADRRDRRSAPFAQPGFGLTPNPDRLIANESTPRDSTTISPLPTGQRRGQTFILRGLSFCLCSRRGRSAMKLSKVLIGLCVVASIPDDNSNGPGAATANGRA